MSEIKYQYAFIDDERDKIISICDITTDNRKQYKYRCIGCGQELLPRAIGSIYRRPHFYHKEVVECSGETYLHRLTKRIIKKKFDEEPTFFVEYFVTKECDKTSCKYRNPYCQESRIPYRVDLKEYYDTCKEEAPTQNGYIADILLTNSKKTNIEPTLIEVWVKHPCDEEKRNSGLRIIEIKIKNEQDVIRLQEEDAICENIHAPKNERNVEFISFKRNIVIPNKKTKIQRYVFDSKQAPNGYLTEIDCDMAQNKLRVDSSLELNVINTKNYGRCGQWNILEWMSKHKGLRRCNLCKFYYATQYEDYAICRLSKKYGKPTHPAMDEAERCRNYQYAHKGMTFYSPNDYLIEEITSFSSLMKQEYKVILAVSPSFDNYDLYKEKFLYYLSEKMKTHSVVVIMGASRLTDMFTDLLSREIDFIKEPHEANWGKYGQDAIGVSNDEMTNRADALIAFWDGRSRGIKNLVELAEQKKLKVAIVKNKHKC